MFPQISHVGSSSGLHAQVADEIDAIDICPVFPVEKTYNIISVRKLSYPAGTVLGADVAAQRFSNESRIVELYQFLVLIYLKCIADCVVLVCNGKCAKRQRKRNVPGWASSNWLSEHKTL